MSLALYRKYRSRTLDEVAGQNHVTELLRRAIANDKVAHAYLFTGPRGVGKTSIARILAHEINQLPYDDDATHLDIVEIDAASNNGVEDIRDLRDRVQIAPVNARKKIYIIDEVHMLSKQAFNALLKTLEEPPEHVVFILATTDIDKVPDTILSRTQRHTFRRASRDDIVQNLQRIARLEKLIIDDEALQLIARHSDGSFRDSVSLFDQLISGTDDGKVTVADVTRSLGLVAGDIVQRLLEATIAGDASNVNAILLELEAQGVPPRTTAAQLIDYLRDNLSNDPQYVRLIDELLDIGRSQHPELKLLTTLSLFTHPVVSSPAPVMPTSSPATSPRAITTPAPKKATEKTPKGIAAPKVVAAAVNETKDTRSTAKIKKATQVTPQSSSPEQPFDWDGYVSHVRANHIALHSVLSKCQAELRDDTLTLYTKSAFYKKKLDTPKYKSLLHDSLVELGYSYAIDILDSAKPLNDSQAARVAAIMGGGEEVSVD